MKYALLPLLLLTAPALAEERTITLTKPELESIIKAETSRAIANYVAQEQSAAAKEVYEKVNKAFTPQPPAPRS